MDSLKHSFSSFRRPSDEQFDELWKRGVLVVDTNILLQLYRVPEATRQEILDILRAFGDRLWIPHHVGLEFERNRLTVIAAARKQAEEILQDFSQLDVLSDKIRALELDKRSVGAEEEPLLKALSAAREKACDVLENVRASQVQLSHEDPVREAIHDLYTGRIGTAPVDQAAVDGLEAEAQKRFEHSVPPGFKDVSKDGTVYVAKGLRYQRRYGDFVVWRQTLDYVKSEGVNLLMYATLDNKEDWCGLRPYPGYIDSGAGSAGGVGMVRYRRNRIPDGAYFFTVTLCDRRGDLLVRRIVALRDAWKSAATRVPHHAIAVVVLPDHLHAVIRMSDGANYSRLWQDIKKGFTRRVDAAVSPWQPRFWERTIRDDADLRAHVDYVHINPMKHGWVERVSDWPHSSFHRFVRRGWLPQD